MKIRARILAASVALVLLLALAAPAADARNAHFQVSPEIELMFGPCRPEERGIDDRFIEFLDGAKSTLDMAFYEFRLDPIVDAVIRAKLRGVAVRVVTDSDNYWARTGPSVDGEAAAESGEGASAPAPATKELNRFAKRLVDAGIPVRPDERSGLMHDKFAVRDGQALWTGSYNLTDTCSYRNANHAVILKSKELCALFTAEFREMFEDGQFGIRSPKHETLQVVNVGAVPVEALFAPEDDPNARIADLLRGAKRSIRFMQFAFTADDLGRILVEGAARKVDVRGIFDRTLYRSTGPYGEYARMADANIPVIVYDGFGKFHHKVFLIDAGTSGGMVVLGSQNASTNGNRQNDENVLVIRSAELAKRFAAEFTHLFGEQVAVTTGLAADDLPLAETSLETVDLYLHGNGNDVDRISVEFPARWSVGDTLADGIAVIRRGAATTARENLKVTKRSIELSGANLTGWGANSMLVLRVTGLRLPGLAGRYAVPVRVAAPGGAFRPVAHPPSIWVIDGESPEGFEQLLRYVGATNARLDRAGENWTAAELDRLKRRVRTLNLKLARHTAHLASGGLLDRVAQGVEFLERQSPKWRRYALDLTGDLADLRKALKARVVAGNDPLAEDLLRRVAALVATAR